MEDVSCNEEFIKSQIRISGINNLFVELRSAKFRCNSYMVARIIKSMKNILEPYSSCECVKPLIKKADFCIQQAENAKFGLTIEVSQYVDQFMAELKKFLE